MKRNLPLIFTAAAASVLAFSVLAQDPSNSKMDDSQSPRQHLTLGDNDQLKDTARVSDLIGMTVRNDQHEKLGQVKNLAVDVESGRVVQVIISSGGFLGLGETLTPVPPGALHHDLGDKVLHLDVSREKFNAAPKCDPAKWDEDTQSNRVSEVYGYYGQTPYFARDGSGTAGVSPASADSLPRNLDGTINPAGARQPDTAQNVAAARNADGQNHNNYTRNPDGTWTRTDYPLGGGANPAWSNLGYVQKTGRLMGASVNNLQGEKIGTVENFIVDLPAGRLVAVIISSGGYLGMDGALSAVPPTALKLNPERDALQLDASREMLATAPHFNSNEWPDFNQPVYVGGVYHAYKVDPYFNPDVTAQPDNTARNARDRDHSTLTPLDQGDSQTDLDTTAQIRKEIMATDGMSLNAQNVKIITLNGHVTLRGPVNTDDEKRQIGDIADHVAQTVNVDNQLEVNQNATGSAN
jgi:sporulation protein YlmC with PRC-barrel domain